MKNYLRNINTQTGGPRNDITPLFKNPGDFKALIRDWKSQLKGLPVDVVAGIDALGFVLGTALALEMKKGFVPIRKKGKLPVKARSVSFVDYTGQQKGLEIGIKSLRAGEKVVLVDDWIETGSQVKAALKLIEKAEARVTAVATIHVDRNSQTRFLEKYRVVSVME